MKRRHFIAMASGGLIMTTVKLSSLDNLGEIFTQSHSEKMPSLFIGHGSPMNAIAENSFTASLETLGKNLSRPQAILCISAHWMTKGTWVTHMQNPKTIHDFYGFPKELFDINYPAPGSPKKAELIQANIPHIKLDDNEWGLDHGTWAVLRKMYPQADVPVLQLSLDMTQPPEYHIKLGLELAKLREKGILILGSGNIVHNLRKIQWEENAKAYDWALVFDRWFQDRLLKRDFKSLTNDFQNSESGRLSVPSMDHYYPMLYVIGAANNSDNLRIEYDEIQNGSISMLSFSFGRV